MSSTGNTKPRVAVLGKTRSILTWFEDLVVALRGLGCEVAAVGTQTETPSEKLLQRREGLRDLTNPLVRERVGSRLEEFAPDLVIALNRPGLPQGLDERWERLLDGRPWVGWLCDNLNRVPKHQDPRFTKVFYFDSGCLPALGEFYGADRAGDLDFLPLAVNPERYPCRIPSQRKPSLVFVGKCSAHRRALFRELRGLGVPLEVYGPGAGDWLRPWRSRRLSADQVARLYAGHAACLNLPQPGNTELGLNLRAFEAPCSGGISLYPDVPDLRRCFEPGTEMLIYQDARDIVASIVPLLDQADRLEEVAAAGRSRVLAEHTFEHRARTIFGVLGFG